MSDTPPELEPPNHLGLALQFHDELRPRSGSTLQRVHLRPGRPALRPLSW